jgi:hypothetical protein
VKKRNGYRPTAVQEWATLKALQSEIIEDENDDDD